MIIDGQADYRTLLMHHVTTHWPDANITSYDPLADGHLPDSFSGAGNDLVLLGNDLGDRDGSDVIRKYLKAAAFPPLVYFGFEDEKSDILSAGASGFFDRDALRHDALIVCLSNLLSEAKKLASTDSLFIGDRATGINPLIRGYRFIRKLSTTEYSAVFLAERESIGKNVVLKVLRQIPDADDTIGAFDRFLQEYEMIAELDHPNIVQIFDLGVGDNHAHIAMEYLEGQITGAMAEIHKVGILHRDLKPANIMLRDDDSIALIDFGLAKRLRWQMEMTGSGEIFGTPYYMSPEQGHGNGMDVRSDIYSLGILLFEMLTGTKPYTGESAMSIIYKHAKAPIPLLLAKRAEDRLQTAAEVLEWL